MSNESELLDRITVRADVFGGKPIIRDMRIAVEHVLGMLAAGDTAETILREYPDLEPEDIQACLRSSPARSAPTPGCRDGRCNAGSTADGARGSVDRRRVEL